MSKVLQSTGTFPAHTHSHTYALRPICCHSRFLSKFAVLVLFEFAVLSVFLLELPE